MSGDVHHTYLSEAEYPEKTTSRIFQVTCSPIHNTIPTFMKLVFRIGWSHAAERVISTLDRFTGVPPLPIRWHHPTGPHFGNALALLVFDGRTAQLVLERSVKGAHAGPDAEGEPQPGLAIIAEQSLTDPIAR